MTVLLTIGVSMVSGLLLSRLARLIKLPAVTAYLVAGVLIGPYLLGRFIPFIDFESVTSTSAFEIISKIALGFIAFAIGNEFRLSSLKNTGKQAFVIGVFQAVTATLVVDVVLIALSFVFVDELSLPVAITLGAIAAATAPAATLMVVRQYKAKGKLTDLLLPIVALDDAVGLVIFAVSFGIAKALAVGAVDMVSIIVVPLVEIIISLILGAAMGLLLTFLERFFHSRSKRLSISIAFVLLTVAISMVTFVIGGATFGFSSLLVCMMLGTVFCNTCAFSDELMERTDGWTTPLFILFFVVSGAELNLNVFSSWIIVLIGVVYILSRAIGKIGGAYISSKWVKYDKKVTNNLGITLLPQAGVALGMSITAMQLEGHGELIRNIVLFSVLILELIGPLLTKRALIRSGDITEGATNARVSNKDKSDSST